MRSARQGEQALPQYSHSFCAPKSILAVRPLDHLTSSHPATHTHARVGSHTLSLRQTRALLATYIVQFEVKAAGVAHRVPVPVAPPQGGGGGLAVCAAGACTSRSGLKGSRRGKYIMNNDPFTCCAREVRAGTEPRKKKKKRSKMSQKSTDLTLRRINVISASAQTLIRGGIFSCPVNWTAARFVRFQL